MIAVTLPWQGHGGNVPVSGPGITIIENSSAITTAPGGMRGKARLEQKVRSICTGHHLPRGVEELLQAATLLAARFGDGGHYRA